MDSFVLLAYASLAALRTLTVITSHLNFPLDSEDLFCSYKQNKKYNGSGPPAFKSQRIAYQSNQKLLHHC